MTVFREGKEIEFKKLIKVLREDSGFVPLSDKRFGQAERGDLLDDVFGLRGEEEILTEEEYLDALRELELSAHDAASWDEKEEIETQLRYLKKFI